MKKSRRVSTNPMQIKRQEISPVFHQSFRYDLIDGVQQ